jgi:hypothetical protein
MSTRERWIVYPLLFLTLGIVMRDKAREMLTPAVHVGDSEITAERIHCSQLRVDQVMDGLAVRNLQCGGTVAAPVVRCTQLQVDQVSAGGILIRGDGPNHQPTVLIGTDAQTSGGVVETLSHNGAPLVLLQPTAGGGVVRAAEVIQGKAAFPEKSKAPATPTAAQPTKETAKQPEKSPVKANKANK